MRKTLCLIMLVGLLALVLSIGGCAPDYGRVKVDDKSVEVEVGKDRDRDDYDNHCPPGHRKKGWCR